MNGGLVNNELKHIWKEEVVVLWQRLPGGSG
jgi:hypothetical protein